MKLNYVLGFLAAISLNISAEIWKDLPIVLISHVHQHIQA